MNILYEIEYLKERSSAPTYLFRVQININTNSYEEVVIYTPNQIPEFNFGKLQSMIKHIPHINTIKAEIRNTKL